MFTAKPDSLLGFGDGVPEIVHVTPAGKPEQLVVYGGIPLIVRPPVTLPGDVDVELPPPPPTINRERTCRLKDWTVVTLLSLATMTTFAPEYVLPV